MKYLTGIICLVILVMTGCASTGSGNYTSEETNWVVIRNNGDSIEGVSLSRLQNADEQRYNGILEVSSNRSTYYSRSSLRPISSELNRFTIITLKYTSSSDGRYIITDYWITGRYDRAADLEAKATAARAQEARTAQAAAAEVARNAPRFSPEGQEYVRRSLIQAAGDANNSTNRGNTLFFQTERISIKEGAMPGQWFVTDSGSSNNPTIMWYYDAIPFMVFPTLLYRAEVSSIGIVRFVIDSFVRN